jgi:imidazole glycerol-phosphate synthase subunit HisH
LITIVDYGVGNISALLNMFEYLGVEAFATSVPREIADARKLILPGVGAFDKAMRTLRERDLVAPLNVAVLERRVPVLGVCLGMQLLARRSEEGSEAGLGWIDADVRRIQPNGDGTLKVPHIGWSDIEPTGGSPLFVRAEPRERFYFVHSYHVVCDRPADVAANIDYGGPLVCAVGRGNIHGAQFHPEKSHRFGMRLLRAYADYQGAA